MFPIRESGGLVYSEAMAHHVALQCELPSPLTFPVICHPGLLRSGTAASLSRSDDNGYVLGIASVDGNPKKFKQIVADSEAAWADVMNWPLVARAAVFDELIANDDRHIGNLVRCGNHEYQLIDHERMLFGEQWSRGGDISHLASRRCDANVLADTIAEGSDEVTRQRMMFMALRFTREMVLRVPDVAEGLELLCHVPKGTTERMIDMLNSRRLLLQQLMQWHAEKGDLFRATTYR